MIRFLTLSMAATIALTVPAYSKSRAETIAYGAVGFAIYSENCDKQPIQARIAIGKLITTIPARTLKAVKAEHVKFYTDLGHDDWCELMQPIVERGTSGIMNALD